MFYRLSCHNIPSIRRKKSFIVVSQVLAQAPRFHLFGLLDCGIALALTYYFLIILSRWWYITPFGIFPVVFFCIQVATPVSVSRRDLLAPVTLRLGPRQVDIYGGSIGSRGVSLDEREAAHSRTSALTSLPLTRAFNERSVLILSGDKSGIWT